MLFVFMRVNNYKIYCTKYKISEHMYRLFNSKMYENCQSRYNK